MDEKKFEVNVKCSGSESRVMRGAGSQQGWGGMAREQTSAGRAPSHLNTGGRRNNDCVETLYSKDSWSHAAELSSVIIDWRTHCETLSMIQGVPAPVEFVFRSFFEDCTARMCG